MNRIFRLVWGSSARQLIPVAETAGGGRRTVGTRSARRARRALLLPLWGSLCWAGLTQGAPTGAQITAGNGSVTQSGNITSILQSSNNLAINWQSFNVSSNEIVNFAQPNAGALAINRILGNSPSEIFGHLNANGQVWLINPNGVLFGRGAQVNVGGIVVTTLDVQDATLDLDGRTFSGAGTGSIVNDGTLRAAEGGYVALLGNRVSNRGIISAQLGTVALAAGSAETLTFSGRQLIHVQVDRSTLNDLAENGQLIEANGGQVIMTAGAKDSLLASAVNNTGVVQAQTVENHDGTITLLAGMQAGEVHVGGTLDARAPTGEAGGAIETSGAAVTVASGAKVLAGPGGSWRIDPTNLTIDATAATAIETSLNGGASVTEQTTATSASGFGTQSAGLGDIDVDAAITWTNPAATLTLSAYHAINVDAAVSGAGPVVMQAANGNLTIAAGASIASNSGVTLGTGASFVNLAGSGALSAGSGARWLVYSTNPTTDTTGGLTPDFIQYAAGFEATPAQTSGDGLLYSVAPAITVTALGGSVSKTYDGGTAATLTAAGSNYTVSGLLNGDAVVSMSGSYQSPDAGSNISVTSAASAAGLTVANSSGVPVYGYALGGSPLTAAIGSIAPAPLSAAIVGDPTKVYDGTTTATLTSANYSLSGFVAGQSATVNQPSSVAYASAAAGPQAVNATFSSTNFVAGSGTNLSNYVLPASATGAGTVLQAPLVITGVLATSKVYDATTVDVLNTANAGIYGVIGTDAVSLSTAAATGSFATANAGNDIGVTTSGFSLTGSQAPDYRLVQPTGLAANITPAPLTITGVSGTNKAYDGTTIDPVNTASAQLSGVVGSDASTLMLSTSGATGAFSSPNVGTALPVTVSGFSISGASASNYDLTQPTGLSANISPAPLTVTLVGNPTKPYNGTTTAALSASNFTLSGFVGGEGATLPQTTLAEYASPNAGTQTVTATLAAPDFAPVGATQLSNYVLPATASGTGTITPAPLTGTLIGNPTKVYDGTTSATLSGANYVLSGFLPGQGATINQTSGVYASANAGVEQVTATVTPSEYIATGGTLLSNYAPPTTFTGSGTITQAALAGYITAGITGNPTKPYDGTTTATLNPANFILTGFANGQGASVTQTAGIYASANAGSQAVTANLTSGDFTPNTGTNLSNYTLPSEAYGTGTITPAILSVGIVGNPTRVYNGNTSMVLSPSNYSVTGFVTGEGASINPSALINYASANVGPESITAALTPSAYTANSGTLLTNYVLASSAGGVGTITPAPLYVTGVYGTNKVYDTTTSDPLNIGAAALAGVVPGDAGNVTLAGTPAGTFSTSQVGNGLPVGVSGYSITGPAASNYALQPISGLGANITPAPLSVAGVNASSKPYDGTNTATLNTSGANLTGVLGSDSVSLSVAGAAGTFSTSNAGNNLQVNASGFAIGGAQSGDYTLGQPSGLTANITPAPITALIVGNPTKVYDGSPSTTLTAANYTLVGFAPSQGASVPQSATASYAAPDAGTGVPITSTLVLSDFVANAGTNLSNYQLPATGAGTGTITQAPLTLALIGNPTKTYDSTTTAALTSANYNLSGFVAGQSATVTQTSGTYGAPNAGSEPVTAALTAANYTAGSGTNLNNYALPASATGAGTIQAAPLTVLNVSTTPQVYNGTTIDALTGATLSGTVYGGDNPVLAAGTYSTGTLGNNGNAGTDSVTTAIALSGPGSSNYMVIQPTGLTALISPAPLTASSSVTKTYDGTTVANLSGTNTTISGFVSGQNATVDSGVTGTFAGSDVGSGLTVTGGALTSGDLTASNGTLLSNYTLPASDNGTGTINPARLTYTATPLGEQYGTTPTGLTGSVSGFVDGQTLATATTGTTVFSTTATSTSDVGHYAIDGSGLTADNGNYVFVQAAGNATALTITPAPLSIVGVTTTSRPYDGTTVDALSGATLVGTFYNGDSPTLTNTATGTLGNNGNVGTDSVTTAMGLTGPGSGNYSLAQPSGLTAVISVVALSATSSVTKSYDGTTVASLSGGNTTLTGFVAGQGATVNSGVTGTFANANVGSGIVVTGAALTSSDLTANNGTLLSNYVLPASDNGTGTITPAIVNLSGTRTYDAATDAAGSVFGSAGTVSTGIGSQTLTLSGLGTLAGKNTGSESLSSLGTLTLANGTGLASNYTLIGGTEAVSVTPAALTYTAGPVSESYGTTPLGLSGAVSGFLGSDSLTNATTGSALFSTTATAASNVGSYAITGSGLTANNGNYTFVQAAANSTALGITPAIVNLSGTRTYDAATDAAGSVFGSAGTVSTGIGSQTLTLSGLGTLAGKNTGSESLSSLGTLTLANGTGLASNYTLIGGTDAVSVTPAALTYAAGPVSESYGTTPLGLSGAVSGFLGSDSLTNATTGSALFSTTATAASNVGSYAITGSGLTANNGNYTFVQAAANSTALGITPAIVNLSGTRTYDAATDAAGSVFGSAGTVSTGIGSQTLTLSGLGTLAGKNTGSESLSSLGTLTLANGTGLASNYTLIGGTDAVSVTPAALTYTAGPVSESYGTTPLGLSGAVSGFLGSDSLTNATTGSALFSTTATAASNVGSYAITGSGLTANNGNYTFVQAAANSTALGITPAIVNLSGTRTYDAATDAAGSVFGSAGTVSTGIGSQTLTLSGLGTLAGKNTGSESLSSLGTLTLANGTGLASNYTLIGGTEAVSVTPAALTYTAGPVSESYGTTPLGLSGAVSGFLGGDSLTNATTGSALFSTTATAASNVGSYAITGSGLTANNGNYTFVQAAANSTALGITPAIVNLSGTRTYDAATDAAGSVFGSAGTVSTGIGSQTLTLSGLGTLAGKNTGSESLSSLGTLTLANGTGLASNYTLIGGTEAVSVTPAALTYTAGPVSESYGTTPLGLSGAVSGFLGGDSLTNATTGSALFSTTATAASNVGSYAITGSGLTANNGNYTFVQAAANSTALGITPAIVNLSGTRTYDAATDAAGSVFGSAGTVSTGIGSQTLTLSGLGTLAGKNTGSESLSSLGTLTLANGTGLASNYTLIGGTDAVSVTPLAITVSATGINRVYNGTVLDAVTLASSGVLAGDQVSFTDGSATFAGKNVGNGKTVSVAGITLGGPDGGDYTVNADATTTANITPATLTESATPVTVAAGKVPALTGTISGFAPGDTLADATTGTLVWSTDAPPYPTLGAYPIDGSGLSAANYVIVQAPSNAYALKVTAMPETAATQRVYGLLNVPLTPPRIATPYGVGSSNLDSDNTGNERRDPDPMAPNRRLTDFTGRLALTVVDGGVRLPTETASPAVAP